MDLDIYFNFFVAVAGSVALFSLGWWALMVTLGWSIVALVIFNVSRRYLDRPAAQAMAGSFIAVLCIGLVSTIAIVIYDIVRTLQA